MRILIFVSSLYGGGAERVASLLSNHLVNNNEVYVATFSDNKRTYQISSKIKIISVLPKSKLSLVRFFQRYVNISRTIDKVSPRIIISFSVSLNSKVLLVNRLKRKKLIVSERTSFSRYVSREADFARRYLYKTASNVVFVSKEDYDQYPYKNKSVIYNPLSFPLFRESNSRDHSILAVGSMKRWKVKGFDTLLKAWAMISANNPEWTLDFMGNDNDNYIHELVDDLGIAKSVRFLGHSDDVASIMQKKSIFVLSSRYEGFPNCLIEAMSQGCACVAYDCHTGPKEIITNGVDGVLVKNQSIEEMATAVQKCISDVSYRNSLAKNGFENVVRFNKENIMLQWEQLINKIVRK